METSLLQTKLHVPSIRPELVPRLRLVERLNEGLHRKMTLVSAPAGFGKTILVAEWAGAIGRPVGWLSLDKGDNNPCAGRIIHPSSFSYDGSGITRR